MAVSLEKSQFYDLMNRLFEHVSYVHGYRSLILEGWPNLIHNPLYRYKASKADSELFGKFEETPADGKYPHLNRWYKHIAASQGLQAKYRAW